jgi:hypothetical protein
MLLWHDEHGPRHTSAKIVYFWCAGLQNGRRRIHLYIAQCNNEIRSNNPFEKKLVRQGGVRAGPGLSSIPMTDNENDDFTHGTVPSTVNPSCFGSISPSEVSAKPAGAFLGNNGR